MKKAAPLVDCRFYANVVGGACSHSFAPDNRCVMRDRRVDACNMAVSMSAPVFWEPRPNRKATPWDSLAIPEDEPE